MRTEVEIDVEREITNSAFRRQALFAHGENLGLVMCAAALTPPLSGTEREHCLGAQAGAYAPQWGGLDGGAQG